MTERALLPTGLEDVLPIDAEFESQIVSILMDCFLSYGYERVKPPLIEFEENLLAGSGEAIAKRTFRVMDPISQRMLGIRPDMTVQVDRIATTRLIKEPRPLRLSYTGQVLRVRGSQLRPERQFAQAGIELIGSKLAQSDAEIIQCAHTALISSGLKDVSIDLGLPRLIPILFDQFDLDEEKRNTLRLALDRKDAKEVATQSADISDLFGHLLCCVGDAKTAIQTIKTLDFKQEAKELVDELIEVYELVSKTNPDLSITIDPVENRGYEYHSGISYTFFAKGVRGELGRGGRYIAGSTENAAGCTLFVDSLMRALDRPVAHEKIFAPLGTEPSELEVMRKEGRIVISALENHDDLKEEARRLGCSHIYLNSKIDPL